MLNDIIHEGGAALAYGGVGIVLMALGYLVVDLTTPGKLGEQIWTARNRGAALVLAAKLLGVGAIVTTAILTSEDGLADGLVSTAVYGVLGLVLTVLAFFLLDVLTPGKLGEVVVDHGADSTQTGVGAPPASWVVAAMDLATAAVVAAAIS